MSAEREPESVGRQGAESGNDDRQPQVADSSALNESLCKLLDYEIEQRKEVEARPGWTPWAILGGLCTAIWLLLDTLEFRSLNLDDVSAVFLVACLSFTSFRFLPLLWAETYHVRGSRARFRPARQIIGNWQVFAVRVAIGIAAIWLVAASHAQGVPLVCASAAFVHFVLLLLVAIALVIFGWRDLPLPAPAPKTGTYSRRTKTSPGRRPLPS